MRKAYWTAVTLSNRPKAYLTPSPLHDMISHVFVKRMVPFNVRPCTPLILTGLMIEKVKMRGEKYHLSKMLPVHLN